MMGMMFLWPIFLLLMLALPVGLGAGAYMLYRNADQTGAFMPSGRSEMAPIGHTRACPSCGRFLQEDWVKCPHCGSEIL